MITINQDELQDDHKENQNEERKHMSMRNKLIKHAKKKHPNLFFATLCFFVGTPCTKGMSLVIDSI